MPRVSRSQQLAVFTLLGVALTLAGLAWGGWTFLLAHEWVTDDWGAQWAVSNDAVIGSVLLWLGLAVATVLTWRRVFRIRRSVA